MFPAHVGGPAFIRSLRAILPGARLIPTGGIAVSQAGDCPHPLSSRSASAPVCPPMPSALLRCSERKHGPFDAVLVGEILVELHTEEPLTAGAALRLGFSGDVLNAAAAATAIGARTTVLTCIADDELGDAILARAVGLGIDTSLIRRTAPNPG
ncbi:MAG TPA: hypothetical protein VF070_18395 [Streptosporangiaceae bacterium]